MMKNQPQADTPDIPSIVVRIAAARRPEKMLDAIFPACQMAMRKGASSFVYHEELIKLTIGKNGPSATPTRKRQRINDQPLLMAAIHAVITDQMMT